MPAQSGSYLTFIISRPSLIGLRREVGRVLQALIAGDTVRLAMTTIAVVLPAAIALAARVVATVTVTAALAASTTMTVCAAVLTGLPLEAHRWKVMDLLVAAMTTRTAVITPLHPLTRTLLSDRTTDLPPGTFRLGSQDIPVREAGTRPANTSVAVVTGKLHSLYLSACSAPSFPCF